MNSLPNLELSPQSHSSVLHMSVSLHATLLQSRNGTHVAQLDTHSVDKYILSRDKAEDRLAAWLDDIQDELGDDIDNGRPQMSSHAKCVKTNPTELHRCSWCGNPSAVLRKCGGCEKAR